MGSSSFDQYGPETRFNDPDWLAWWLQSHYLLTPEHQVSVAERLLDVVYSSDCRDVLQGFIAGTIDAASPGIAGAVAPPSPEESIEEDESPLWLTTAKRLWNEQRTVVLIAGLLCVGYVVQGILGIWRLIA